MRRTRTSCSKPWVLGWRLASGCAALALLACAGEPQGPVPAPPSEKLSPGDFADTVDLLHSIERGTFTKRAGLSVEIEEAKLPPPVTIGFLSGTEVPAEQRGALRKLASQLEADRRLAVDLVGCSDPSGSAAVNQRISQARAESVARSLKRLGVNADQLARVVGRGEQCEQKQRMVLATPLYPKDDVGEQVGGDAQAAQGRGDA